jgi:hypothetical protein
MSTRAPTASRSPSRFTRDADGGYQEVQRPAYQSPSLRYDELGNKINAHPASNIYAPGTGSGTGKTAVAIGSTTPDGTRYPKTKMGSDTRPLSPPRPTMGGGSAHAMAQRQQNVMAAKADGSFAFKQAEFNRLNPGLHLHDDGHIAEHPQAAERLAAAQRSQSGSAPPPTPPSQSSAGQAQSMREASAPNPGEDRYGRTSASPSAGGRPVVGPSSNPSSMARSEWQQGTPGTRSISDQYGAGAVSFGPRPGTSSTAVSRAPNTGVPAMDKAFPGPADGRAGGGPVLKPGGGAASFRSPTGTPSGSPSSFPPPDSQIAKNAADPAFQQRLKDYDKASANIKARESAVSRALNTGVPAMDKAFPGPAAPKPSDSPSAMADSRPAAPSDFTMKSMGDNNPFQEALDNPESGATPTSPNPTAAAPKYQEQTDFDRQPALQTAKNIGSAVATGAKAVATGAGAALGAFKEMGERGAEWFDNHYIHNEKLNPPATPPVPTPTAPPSQMGGNPPPIPAIKEPVLPRQPGDPTPDQVTAAKRAAQNQDDGDGPDKEDEKDDEEDRTV